LKSGRDKFTHRTKQLGGSDLVFANGIYPYSYMTGRDKFAETRLPLIEPCPPKNYDLAREIWAHYDMKTMQNYHDHCLLSDVLLLAAVFQNIRNSKPNSWITYLDANNLYESATSEPLPEGNFCFLSQNEISDIDLMDVPTHGDTGYIVECNLKYPEKLHELHSDYLIAPEHLTVSPDMLSNFYIELKDKIWIFAQKLIPN